MTNSVQVPVSGSHINTLVSGDRATYYKVMATFAEIDRVDSLFEDLRTKINAIDIQYPQHSVFPQVLDMVETMVGPISDSNQQKEFAQNLKTTVETIMPWQKFLDYSSVVQ